MDKIAVDSDHLSNNSAVPCNLYQLFGPPVLFIVMGALSSYYIRNVDGSPQHLLDFIVLISVTATLLYSFLFLIAPQFRHDEGVQSWGVVCLAVLMVVSVVFSVLLISVYLDRAFLGAKSDDGLYIMHAAQKTAELLFSKAPHGGLSDHLAGHWSVHYGVECLIKYHFLLVVGIFTAIDAVFARWSHRPLDRRRFTRIIIIVDVPILVAVSVVIGIKDVITHPAAKEVFESGAISFQFVTGCATAYLMDHYWQLKAAADRVGQVMRATGRTIWLWLGRFYIR